MNEREKALDHKCPGCGGKVIFSPEIGKWKCEYCKTEYTLEELQKHNNAASEEANKNDKESNANFVEYHCKNCGAEIIADEQTAATFCVYCGNTAILKNKLTGKFAPSKIIPFSKSKEEALAAFRSLNKGRPLMPKFFNQQENIEKLSGVYIPFWLFDIESNGKLDSDSKKVTSWVDPMFSYTKTDTYAVSRDVDYKYEKIPVDGSTRFEDALMNTIEPFYYNKMVDYNHAYLSGFLAEKYDVESKEASEAALKRANTSTKQNLMASLSSYTSNRVKNENITSKVVNTEYVLLPVWMVNVKYLGKFYTFAMNAQSGEFIGDIPIDKKKQWIYTIGIFLGVALVILAISFLIYKGGAR